MRIAEQRRSEFHCLSTMRKIDAGGIGFAISGWISCRTSDYPRIDPAWIKTAYEVTGVYGKKCGSSTCFASIDTTDEDRAQASQGDTACLGDGTADAQRLDFDLVRPNTWSDGARLIAGAAFVPSSTLVRRIIQHGAYRAARPTEQD